jgi:hypothetical protein
MNISVIKEAIKESEKDADRIDIDDFCEGYHRGYAKALKDVLDGEFEEK